MMMVAVIFCPSIKVEGKTKVDHEIWIPQTGRLPGTGVDGEIDECLLEIHNTIFACCRDTFTFLTTGKVVTDPESGKEVVIRTSMVDSLKHYRLLAQAGKWVPLQSIREGYLEGSLLAARATLKIFSR